MLHMWREFLWFIIGGWIGSIVTLIMVALLRKSREAPKPTAAEETEPASESPRTGTHGT